jgi:hypothetical protein
MRTYLLLLVCTLSFAACQTQTTQKPAAKAALPALPPPFKVPNGISLDDLKWGLREALRTQLPLTYPEKRGSRDVKKSYSFDLEKHPTSGEMTLWTIPEKLHDAHADTIFSGGKYYLPLEYIDPNAIQRVFSPDSTQTGIAISAYPELLFTYRPYTNEPDKTLTTIQLGWYDRVQDATIERALGYMRALLAKMREPKK